MSCWQLQWVSDRCKLVSKDCIILVPKQAQRWRASANYASLAQTIWVFIQHYTWSNKMHETIKISDEFPNGLTWSEPRLHKMDSSVADTRYGRSCRLEVTSIAWPVGTISALCLLSTIIVLLAIQRMAGSLLPANAIDQRKLQIQNIKTSWL